MSPQPMNHFKDIQYWHLGAEPFAERPHQASKIMSVITLWSHIDLELSNILCSLMKADHLVVAKMFFAIDGAEARNRLLESASKAALADDEVGMTLLRKVLERLKSGRKTRHKFAHQIWMVSNREDVLLLSEPKYRAFNEARSMELGLQTSEFSDNEKVYTNDDLERELQTTKDLVDLVSDLRACFDSDIATRVRYRGRLSSLLGVH